jgi:hypothetical protein
MRASDYGENYRPRHLALSCTRHASEVVPCRVLLLMLWHLSLPGEQAANQTGQRGSDGLAPALQDDRLIYRHLVSFPSACSQYLLRSGHAQAINGRFRLCGIYDLRDRGKGHISIKKPGGSEETEKRKADILVHPEEQRR